MQLSVLFLYVFDLPEYKVTLPDQFEGLSAHQFLLFDGGLELLTRGHYAEFLTAS